MKFSVQIKYAFPGLLTKLANCLKRNFNQKLFVAASFALSIYILTERTSLDVYLLDTA